METGSISQETHCLLTHKGYAVEMVELIIKETDLDHYIEQETEKLGVSGLFDLSRVFFFSNSLTLLFIRWLTVVIHFQVLVCMKALQDKCIAEEGVITRLRKQNETLTNEQVQYKGALRTLNEEVTTLKGKMTEETNLRKKAEEVKTSMEKKLKAFLRQVEKARANAVMEFKAS